MPAQYLRGVHRGLVGQTLPADEDVGWEEWGRAGGFHEAEGLLGSNTKAAGSWPLLGGTTPVQVY